MLMGSRKIIWKSLLRSVLVCDFNIETIALVCTFNSLLSLKLILYHILRIQGFAKGGGQNSQG